MNDLFLGIDHTQLAYLVQHIGLHPNYFGQGMLAIHRIIGSYVVCILFLVAKFYARRTDGRNNLIEDKVGERSH